MSLDTLPDKAIVNRVNNADRVDRREIQVSGGLGGIAFTNMAEVMSFASLMAKSDIAIPKHLRDNPGACMAVVLQAIEWRMSPYAVAGKSYVVNDRIGYESQLIHAVVEMRAPLIGRLKNRFIGDGDTRQCIISAKVKGESEPLEFQSAPFGKIQPKNSPLWKTKPDLQLYYNASRDWARMYFPDVILGVYAEDEIEQAPPVGKVELMQQRAEAAISPNKNPPQAAETFDDDPPFGKPTPAQSTAAPQTETPAESTAGTDSQDAPGGDDSQLPPPELPKDYDGLVSVVANLCGMELDDAANGIKLHLRRDKPWEEKPKEYRAAWWMKFLSGSFKEITPKPAA